MKGITTLKGVSETKENRRDWLALRQRTIGSSDIAAIAGFNKWRSPLKVWMEKTGKIDPEPENENMLIGKLMEQPVAELFKYRHAEENLVIETAQCFIVHPEYQFASCTPDNFILNVKESEEQILETKAAKEYRLHEFEEGQVPDDYRLQVMWQLGVTGLKVAYLAALIGGFNYREAQITFDHDMFQTLMSIASTFKEQIEKDLPPNAGPGDSKIIKELYKSTSEVANLSTARFDLVELHDNLMRIKAEKSKLKAEVESKDAEQKLIQNNIAMLLKGADTGICEWAAPEGKVRLTIKNKPVNNPGYTVKPFSYDLLTVKREILKEA